jgi:hypothetical protein
MAVGKLTARQLIAANKRASILRVFPSQWLDRTLDEIDAAARAGDRTAQTAKLLTEKRFNK